MRSELLGFFPYYSWQEKIAANVGMPIDRINAMTYGKIVNDIVEINKRGNFKSIEDLSKSVNIDIDMIRKILVAYENYKATGKLFLLKEIPSGVGRFVSNVGKGTGEAIKPISTSILWPVAIVAAAAGVIYILSKGK